MSEAGEAPEGLARKRPTQQRSRERYERILAAAEEILVEQGAEAFTMSEVSERSGAPFGSLYQYFPDKTALIGTLATRYNQIGRACVAGALAPVRDRAELRAALAEIVDAYFQAFQEAPAMRDIWTATQSDRRLQALDAEDVDALAGFLAEAMGRLAPEMDVDERGMRARIVMEQIAAGVRYAITLPTPDGARAIALFKRMGLDPFGGAVDTGECASSA